jgi:hypothetical protein
MGKTVCQPAALFALKQRHAIGLEAMRRVDRLADLPVAVYEPSWTIITWKAAWAALMGDPSAMTGRDRT